MLANKFIVASFVYNEDTKKESTKYFVAKVLKIISKNEIKIDCLRPFKEYEYNHKFRYLNVRDVNTIKFNQIKFELTEPVICRGVHTFAGDVF
jgi:hypothetical protein